METGSNCQSQMEPSTFPMTSIQTGLTQEERSFEWKITNFSAVRKHTELIKSQRFEFYAGESIGMTSKWRAYLNIEGTDVTTCAGIFVKLVEKPRATAVIQEHLYAQLIFTFKGRDGSMKKEFDTKVVDWYDNTVIGGIANGFGFAKIFDMSDEIPSYVELVDGSLVVYVTFRLFALSNAIQPLKVKLDEFEVNSTAKARAELPVKVMESPDEFTYVKIIASDKKEMFWMQRGILSARSLVFKAMLETDMIEGNIGVVEIPDMGSKSAKVMLHFINCGELLPEWSSSEVIAELTNAAAKYELTDLLLFLDGVLGDVCNLHNVGTLIALAGRLSLKTAEADLLSFLKKKGATSAETFIQVSNGILASESRAEEALSGASAGSSGDLIEHSDLPDSQPSGCSCSCRCGSQGKRSGVGMAEDNEVEKSVGKPPKKTRKSKK